MLPVFVCWLLQTSRFARDWQANRDRLWRSRKLKEAQGCHLQKTRNGFVTQHLQTLKILKGKAEQGSKTDHDGFEATISVFWLKKVMCTDMSLDTKQIRVEGSRSATPWDVYIYIYIYPVAFTGNIWIVTLWFASTATEMVLVQIIYENMFKMLVCHSCYLKLPKGTPAVLNGEILLHQQIWGGLFPNTHVLSPCRHPCFEPSLVPIAVSTRSIP